MEKWWFVDMETLGVDTNSKVLSIGILCVPEDMKSASEDVLYNNGLHILLDIDSQKNRVVDKHTLDYWTEFFKTFDNPFKGKHWSIEKSYSFIKKYIELNKLDSNTDIVWSRGLFDKYLWKSLYGEQAEILPHYMWRDSITALDILTGNSTGNIPTKYMKKKHDALYNCVFEFKRLRDAEKSYE